MSVYSGFATRQMEQQYNNLTKTLLLILTKRISKIYTQKTCNEEAFKQILIKVCLNMGLMERHKYMMPKYSESILSLLSILQGIPIYQEMVPTQVSLKQPSIPQSQKKKQLSQIMEQSDSIIQMSNKMKYGDQGSDMPPPPLNLASINKISNVPQKNIHSDKDININQISQKFYSIPDSEQSYKNRQQSANKQDKASDVEFSQPESLPTDNVPNQIVSECSSKPPMQSRQDQLYPYHYNNNRYFKSNSLRIQEPKLQEKLQLRNEEIILIENMLREHKLQKPKKKKNRRVKKRCAFEKLLMQFNKDNEDNNQLVRINPPLQSDPRLQYSQQQRQQRFYSVSK